MCEQLSCISETGCIEPFPNGDIGDVLAIDTDGTPDWIPNLQFTCDRLAECGINALADVDTVTAVPAAGHSLMFNGTTWMPSFSRVFGCGDLNACSIDALADVATAGAANGNVLVFDGTSWVPGAPATAAFTCADLASCSIDALADVVSAGAVDGDSLVFLNGNWVPGVGNADCPPLNFIVADGCEVGGIGDDYMIKRINFNQATCNISIDSAPEHTTAGGSAEVNFTNIVPAGNTVVLQDFSITLTNPSACRSMRYLIAVRPGRPAVQQGAGNRWFFITETFTTDPAVAPHTVGTYARFDARSEAAGLNEQYPSGAEFYTSILGPSQSFTYRLQVSLNSAPNFVADPFNAADIGRSYLVWIGSTI